MRSSSPLQLILLLLFVLAISSCKREEQRPPNILFIAVDDLNDWTGFLGGHPQALTPNMDALAKTSTVFACAHATATACQPSRNSVLWGLHPIRTGWYENLFNRKEVDRVSDSIAKISTALPLFFKNQGYQTMMAGKVFHYGPADGRGMENQFWDEIQEEYPLSKEFRERGHNYGDNFYHPFPSGGSPIVARYGDNIPGNSLCGGPLVRDKDIPNGEMPDEYFASWGEAKLAADYDKPFFLALGFVRPHVPFTAPAEFFEFFKEDSIQIPDVPDQEMSDIPVYGKSMALGFLPGGDHHTVLDMGPEYWADLVRSYLASIAFVDAQVGRVLDALEKSPYADNTIVVLWSDHGQNLGEKLMWRKMNLWEEASHVPLLIHETGRKKGQTVDVPVSLLDLYPTLVELAGFKVPEYLDGSSLIPLITEPETSWDTPVLTSWMYDNFAVRSKQWRYIRYRDGTEELYDHHSDPEEHFNLAGNLEYATVLEQHRKYIPVCKADPFFKPFEGDLLDRLVNQWDSTGIPAYLQ